MKFVFSIIALCAIQAIHAQKITKKSYPSDQIEIIRVDSDYANIEMESYNGSDILIETSVNINLNMDNNAHSTLASQDGSAFVISSSVNFENVTKRLIVRDNEGNTTIVSADDATIKSINDNEDNYQTINYGYQTDVTIKIKVPKTKNIFIESIYGDFKASGMYKDIEAKITYGDIEIKQSTVSAASTIKLESTYGHVDYSIPHTSDIEFNLSTSYGEIFTGLDVVSSKKDVFAESNSCGNQRGGKYILNEGKSTAHITATYDDIYLRGN